MWAAVKGDARASVHLQPASLASKTVRKHYEDTIVRPVRFADHAALLDPAVLQTLRGLFPREEAQMWGVTPGQNNANVPKIAKMRPGDVVFFSGNKRLYLAGTVALAWHNPALAEHLWSRDEDTGLTWEYMYALSGVRGLDVPMDEVRRLLGWKPTRNIMGFNQVKQEEGELLLELIDFDPGDAATSPTTHQLVSEGGDRTEQQHGSSDKASSGITVRRAEQDRIKAYLLPGSEGDCALCGRTLPKEFLVAAHIKKRAACTEEERWDVQNVAMLACLLGCDSLFEHGFIAVDHNGDVQVSEAAENSPTVSKHIDEHLADRHVTWWNPKREKYYAWHRANTFKTGAPSPERIA
ncbi:hypothetical protein D8771_25000 [Streptomyces albus]|uniref:HNH endonuclease n=1 Tax=Streptomyces albus TaxID=1888 RepID=A0A8H1L6H3_9ACTN|nr:hypothetical protein D8771_25000 [Streptomyces albus]